MKRFILCLIVLSLASAIVGLPVTKTEKPKTDEKTEEHENSEDVADALEYERYLKEVVNALETDEEFRKKLDNASDVDIRSGKIAHELEHVSHHVRSKLDEIKRREIERLRLLAIKEYELSNDIDREHLKIASPKHLDHDNQYTFEIDDLKKLILKTSEDLAEADRKRRDEFKEYELQKEFEKQEKLRAMDEEHRKKYEEELKTQQQKHNKHEKLHHPGNKAQLEEVWQEQDHMDPSDFDPKTFFMMHDTDGNNYWDQTETKAIFVKELDKVYQTGLPEDDMRERAEEMERMREEFFRETDTNHDNLISMDEFIVRTKKEEFQQDPGWETVDNQPQFTHEEYLEFERRRQQEVQRLIASGQLPPHPNMPHGYYPDQYNQHGQYPNQHPGQQYPNQHPGQQYPNQHPGQQYPNQHAGQQPNPNIQYQYQAHPNAVPQQGQQLHYQQQPQYQQQYQYQHGQAPAQHQPVQLNQNQVYQHVPDVPAQQQHNAPAPAAIPNNAAHPADAAHANANVVQNVPVAQQQHDNAVPAHVNAVPSNQQQTNQNAPATNVNAQPPANDKPAAAQQPAAQQQPLHH